VPDWSLLRQIDLGPNAPSPPSSLPVKPVNAGAPAADDVMPSVATLIRPASYSGAHAGSGPIS
jgi:hypothetical protein